MSNEEIEIRRHFEGRDLRAATTAALEAYGAEIFGLLCSLHRDEDEASDAFSLFAERLWRSMDRFEWKCSMRTWAYVVARRASHDVRRAEHRHEKRGVRLSDVEDIAEIAAKVRTATATLLRTETKTALQRLREELPADDQLLLVLRVDRQMAWDDLARVFDAEADPQKESARLRKRFQFVKEKLFALGKQRGILG